MVAPYGVMGCGLLGAFVTGVSVWLLVWCVCGLSVVVV